MEAEEVLEHLKTCTPTTLRFIQSFVEADTHDPDLLSERLRLSKRDVQVRLSRMYRNLNLDASLDVQRRRLLVRDAWYLLRQERQGVPRVRFREPDITNQTSNAPLESKTADNPYSDTTPSGNLPRGFSEEYKLLSSRELPHPETIDSYEIIMGNTGDIPRLKESGYRPEVARDYQLRSDPTQIVTVVIWIKRFKASG